ncbi:MAG: MAPEG family protein [Acetobacteraceae bacterium]|nr:MAPEG family protein [Acetobacteraceae bacterium]
MAIVPYYAAVLALLFVFLSVNTIRGRREHRIALGVSGNSDLERRVRVHGNFAEYAPFALFLIAMAEVRGAPPLVVHALCLSLVFGRLAHAWGVSRTDEDFRFRVAGMAATFATIGGAALAILLG